MNGNGVVKYQTRVIYSLSEFFLFCCPFVPYLSLSSFGCTLICKFSVKCMFEPCVETKRGRT